MEDVNKIREFFSIVDGSGDGSGYGYGDGSGYGYGDGYGYGSVDGSGDGSGYGYGYGYGYGSVDGPGDGSGYRSDDGSGYGSVDGSGDGSGYGYGDGYGIKTFAGDLVWLVDEVQTLIDKVRGNIAKGRILMGDLTTKTCYIIKQNGMFAHGETLREARDAITEKLFDGMSEEERIEAFMKEHKLGVPYPNQSLYDWHHRLTGSCDMGRKAFVADHGLSLDGETTVEEFIHLTRNAYGGSTIRKLEERYKGSVL